MVGELCGRSGISMKLDSLVLPPDCKDINLKPEEQPMILSVSEMCSEVHATAHPKHDPTLTSTYSTSIPAPSTTMTVFTSRWTQVVLKFEGPAASCLSFAVPYWFL